MYSFISQQTYEDNQVIFYEGTSIVGLYIILKGVVELSRMFRGKKLVLETLKEGDLFGELDYMGRKIHSSTAITRGEVNLGLIDQRPLAAELSKLSRELRSTLKTLEERRNKLLDMTLEMVTRDNARILRSLAVSFQNDDQIVVKAYSRDISSGGLFIKTKNPLEQGRQFRLNLFVPGLSEPLELECEAVWVRTESAESSKPSGMGVKFLNIPEKDKEILDPYIKIIERISINSFKMSEKDTRILQEYLGTIESISSSV